MFRQQAARVSKALRSGPFQGRALHDLPDVDDPAVGTTKRFCLILFFLWAVGMTNVGGLVAPEGILSDIRRMIPDPFKGASNEDKIDVAWHELRVQGGSLNEFFVDVVG